MSQALYRGLDRSEIDRQLNLRARWPEHGSYFARWARDSAAVRGRLDGHIDLAYGESAGQRLDLFVPGGGPPVPLLIFIHGGYWQSLDKGDFSYLAPPFMDEGIAFASLNYDLAPQARIPEMVGQVRRAIQWLARQAEVYGLDRTRFYIAGHSAGGHLAVMAQLTDWDSLPNPDAAGTPLDHHLIKGACAISGIYELEPIRCSYQQDVLRLDNQAVETMSPARLVQGSEGPLILAVGGEETEEFLRQQAEFAAAWRAHGQPVEEVALPGRNHFTAVDALGEAGHPLFTAVRAMIGRA